METYVLQETFDCRQRYSLAILDSTTLNERRKMAVLANNNNNYEAPKKAKNDKISELLNSAEIESVKKYLGPQILCVNSGVVQLLRVDEGPGKGRYWTYMKVGVITYCREKHGTPSLRLLDPIEGERARELWRMDIKDDFMTQRSSSEYLLTLETRDGDFMGFNFSDAQEANSFQCTVQLQKEKRSRKINRNSYVENAIDAPLRTAPPPPGCLSDSNRSERVPSITSVGILPTLTKEERKAKKNSIFQTITNTLRRKKKKKRPALTTFDIGNPTNFEHRMHLGSLDADDQETVKKLADHYKVDQNNEKEMQVLIENVVRRGEAIRQSMKMPPKKKETQSPVAKFEPIAEQPPPPPQQSSKDPLADVWGDGNRTAPSYSSNSDSSLQRSPGGSLVDARNSIRLNPKSGSRKTPHMIKQANQPRIVGRAETTSYPSTSTLTTTTTMNTFSSWQTAKDDAPPPPTPQRTTSRREPSQAQHDRPRLWDRSPPKAYPATPQSKPSTTFVNEKFEHKVKSEPNGASVAPIAAAPPPPPPLPSKVDSSAPPPPPPLPPTLQVTPAPKQDKTAKDTNGDSQPPELMAAIRNFASTGLRPISTLSPQTGRESPQPPSPIQTPGDSILMSIQMELEKRRVHISDSESECEDDSSSDSDWK